MSLLTCARNPQLAQDAARWNTGATITRATRLVAPVIRQGFEILLTVAGMLAIVLASLALDVWICVPRPGH
jgi:hypothetical protein